MEFFYIDCEDIIYTEDKYLPKSRRYDDWMEHYDEYLGQYSISVERANEIREELQWEQIEGKINKFDTYDEYIYELVKRLDYEQERLKKESLGLL